MKHELRLAPSEQVNERDFLWYGSLSRMKRTEFNLKAASPSAPVLEGEAAEGFWKTIEKNKTRSIPKEDFDRAQRAYKSFIKPEV